MKLILAAVVFVSLHTMAQTPATQPMQPLHDNGPRPTFEVATVRLQPPAPAPPADTSGGTKPVLALMGMTDARIGDRVHLTGFIRFLIAYAYGISIGSESRVTGGPTWLNTDDYDIRAKIDGATYAAMQKMTPADRKHQLELMEQALFADRFHLKMHRETETLPVYALEVATGGSKLVPAKSNEAPLMPVLFSGRSISVTATAISMGQFVHSPLWRPITNRLIIDNTGLNEKYDFTLNWTSDTPNAGDSDADLGGPSIFTALQQQLGLKLVPTKAPVEVLVIDSISRPTDN